MNLPQPVRTLAAERVGDTVRISFAVPEKTTDKLPVRGEMSARLCRSLEEKPCQPVATAPLTPQQKTAVLEDRLPADLTYGPPRLLSYRVSVLNRAGKAAPDSVPAYAAAGAAPPPVNGFAATPRRRGIVLSWQTSDAAPSTTTRGTTQAESRGPGTAGQGNAAKNSVGTSDAESVRFERTRTSVAHPAPSQADMPGLHATPEPAEQTLQVSDKAADHPGVALDATARVGNTYRYTAQRVARLALAGHDLQMAGTPGPAVIVEYRDIFPPPIPTGLVSAVDTPAHAIDLSWTPDTDPGLAGYIVYRRTIVGTTDPGSLPEKISPGGKPVPAPAWRDTNVTPGQRYAYSVTAVDASGNESARSAEVEEELATRP